MRSSRKQVVVFSHQVVSNFFVTPWTAAHQASLSLTISWGLPKWISDAIQPSHPPSRCCSTFNLSRRQKVFSSESAVHIRWPKYWSFSFSISPSSECSGLISFRIDWFDLLAVQGTLKSLFQHHSSRASILRRSRSSFCWLYTTFLSSATRNAINLILVLTIWWYPCGESSLVLLKKGIFYDQWILLAAFC